MDSKRQLETQVALHQKTKELFNAAELELNTLRLQQGGGEPRHSLSIPTTPIIRGGDKTCMHVQKNITSQTMHLSIHVQTSIISIPVITSLDLKQLILAGSELVLVAFCNVIAPDTDHLHASPSSWEGYKTINCLLCILMLSSMYSTGLFFLDFIQNDPVK